ncbi:MAG: phosphatidate cytidylyltransferase [Cellvibrionaceae bacterium]|jgi:phosphatidate cytidylyltransferase
MLKLRIITAALLLSTFLVVLFLLPFLAFVVFVTAVVLIGAWEWANLSGFESGLQRLLYVFATAFLMILVGIYVDIIGSLKTSALMDLNLVRNIMLVAGVWWAVALLWVQGYPSSAVLWGQGWVRAFMGWLVLLPMWLAVIYLDQLSKGPWLTLLLLLTVVVADTGAYFFGRAFGKRKLAVNVSPGKSWEGFWGGLFCCAILAVVVAAYTDSERWLVLMMILLVTSLSSVLGDLLESMVKRYRNIKDSGSILPGHGGVMDRIDSITAAAPIFVLALLLSGWGL